MAGFVSRFQVQAEAGWFLRNRNTDGQLELPGYHFEEARYWRPASRFEHLVCTLGVGAVNDQTNPVSSL